MFFRPFDLHTDQETKPIQQNQTCNNKQKDTITQNKDKNLKMGLVSFYDIRPTSIGWLQAHWPQCLLYDSQHWQSTPDNYFTLVHDRSSNDQRIVWQYRHTRTDSSKPNAVTKHVPNVRVDEVSKVGGVDTLDEFCVDGRKVMVVLTCFLLTDTSNSTWLSHNQCYLAFSGPQNTETTGLLMP